MTQPPAAATPARPAVPPANHAAPKPTLHTLKAASRKSACAGIPQSRLGGALPFSSSARSFSSRREAGRPRSLAHPTCLSVTPSLRHSCNPPLLVLVARPPTPNIYPPPLPPLPVSSSTMRWHSSLALTGYPLMPAYVKPKLPGPALATSRP